MLHPVVTKLPPPSRKRFEEAYADRMKPIAWGEHDDIVVGILQAWLFTLGFLFTNSKSILKVDAEGIMTDGIFRNETRDAVIAFQTKYELKPDGLVGHNTLDKLYEKLHGGHPRAPITRNASVTVAPKPYLCPPGTLICAEPPNQSR